MFDAFAVDERESAALVERVLADAADGLAGVQLITDQGTPYLAEAAEQAYDALGVEHAPQREGMPTEKATVERGFGTVKQGHGLARGLSGNSFAARLRLATMLALELDDNDDIGFVHEVRPIIEGVLHVVEPAELFIVKVDSWFGDKWLGFSNKLVGAVGVQYRATLRVPPFVPARVVSQRFLRRDSSGTYVDENTVLKLHIEQTSEDNAKRLMTLVCPNAAVFWWSGSTRRNQRGALMAYLPTPDGHNGWYAELKKVGDWKVAQTLRTTARELAGYATHQGIAS